MVIADGHHRYETALTYRQERSRAGETQPNDRRVGADAVMTLVVELAEDELEVGPIHRGLSGLPDGLDLVDAFSSWFDVTRAGDFDDAHHRRPRGVRGLGPGHALGRLVAVPQGRDRGGGRVRPRLLDGGSGHRRASRSRRSSSSIRGTMPSVRWPPTGPRRWSSCGRSRSTRSPSGPAPEDACRRRAPTSTPSPAPGMVFRTLRTDPARRWTPSRIRPRCCARRPGGARADGSRFTRFRPVLWGVGQPDGARRSRKKGASGSKAD